MSPRRRNTGTKKFYVSPAELFPRSDTAPSGSYRDHYQFYHLDEITEDIRFKTDDVEEARGLIANEQVAITEVYNGFASARHSSDLVTVVKGIFIDKAGEYDLSLQFDKHRIQAHTCHYRGCFSYNNFWYGYSFSGSGSQLCAHIIALLLLTHEYLKTHPYIADATNFDGLNMLSQYAKQLRHVERSDVSVKKDVILEPRFEWDGAYLDMGFKVGIDRLYVVKNIRDLYQTISDKGVYPLGKKSEISFVLHELSEESLPYYKLIESEIRQENLLYRNRYYEPDAKKTLPLYGRLLDRVFELSAGKSFPFKSYTGKASSLTFRDHDIRPKLTIEPLEQRAEDFSAIRLTGSIPSPLEGVNSYYVVEGSYLNRLSPETLKAILPLMTTGGWENLDIVIGRGHLGDFYHDVLPMLEDHCDITIKKPSLVEAFVPPKAEFHFYLDTDQKDIILQATVAYDDIVHDLDPLKVPREVYRNANAEKTVLAVINELFSSYDPETRQHHCDRDEDTIYHLLEYGISQLMSYGEVHATDRFSRLRINRRMKLTLGVSLKSNLLTLDISTRDLSDDELLEVLSSYRQKKKYHRLKNGEFISFEEDNTGVLSLLLDEMNVSPKEFVKGKMHLPAYRSLYLDRMLETHDDIATSRDHFFKDLIRNMDSIRNAQILPPEGLKDTLRNYQLYGFRWLVTLAGCGFGGILADDMGLGKTLQVLTLLLYQKEQKTLSTSLVVCPASLVYNWGQEAAGFTPQLSVALVAGTPKERQAILENAGSFDLLVTSYSLLQRDVALYDDIDLDYQILDEAQYIKNAKTGAAKAVKILNAKHRFALTGTPIENRLSELWSIFDFLMPGFLYPYQQFRSDFEIPIITNQDKDASERLKHMVSPFLLRRLKQNVLKDLPDKLEETRYVAFDKEQQKLYDAQVVHLQTMLKKTNSEDFNKSKILVLAELTKLRQICCDPLLLYDNFKGSSAKRDALGDLIATAMDGGHKMLVFSQFVSMLSFVEEDLKANGIPYYLITGETKKEERLRLVNAFNKDDTPVFLISLKAGGTGLNLVGADIVIHYDPWWNVAVQNQATDRAHRIGQKNVVSVFKLIAKNTIEEKIQKLQETKRELADEILSGENTSLTSLSKEDLLELLG